MEGPRKRRRPALSCHECQRRKVRCDHNHPCGPCARHKAECVYSRFRPGLPAHGAGDGGVPSPGGSAVTTASPEQTALLYSLPSPSLSRAGMMAVEGAEAAEVAEVTTATQHGPTLDDLLRRIQKLEEAISSQTSTANPTLHTLSEAADQRNHVVAAQNPLSLQQHRQDASQQSRHPILNKPEDWDKRGWLTGSPEFAAIMGCFDEIGERDSKNPRFRTPRTRAIITQAIDLLQSCKSIAKSIRVDQPARDFLSFPGSGLVPPPRERSDEMVKLYFSSFESTYVCPPLCQSSALYLSGWLIHRPLQPPHPPCSHLLGRVSDVLGPATHRLRGVTPQGPPGYRDWIQRLPSRGHGRRPAQHRPSPAMDLCRPGPALGTS